jgi:hypothetical protein
MPPCPNQRHLLSDILVMAVYAVICGADGWEDIEKYDRTQAEWFAQLMALRHVHSAFPAHYSNAFPIPL